ncbi:MAG TPA: DUF5684 domain-containing protein [Pedobacter sp.]|uniref:DUF5684 domain-containing protein n=1 Tax=Pedobacter sp. TaxID=1411316 RepID=UPI002D0040BD|nr:DUF5684 domain-containing protein [Pedobacter sp.]HMI03161.1 DUF5684 domain-containing protein [Pedobacter sp.]
MDYNSENAVAAGFGAGMLIFCLAVAVITYAGLWKMFVKAGKPGWAAIIPIYNSIVMIEIVGKPVIWILWLLIPCVNIVFGIWLLNLLSKSFGKSEGYTVGMIVLPMVFFPLLGFGDAKYVGPSAAEAQNKQDFFNSPPTTPNA